jgi:hypothetical protein
MRSCRILQGSVSTKDTDDLVEVDRPDVPKCLYVINMFGNDLKARAISKKWRKDGYNYTHLDAKGDKRWELPLLAF